GGIGSLNGPATNLFLPSGRFEFGKNLMSNALPTPLGAAAPGKSFFAFLNLFFLPIKNQLQMNTSTFFHQLRLLNSTVLTICCGLLYDLGPLQGAELPSTDYTVPTANRSNDTE